LGEEGGRVGQITCPLVPIDLKEYLENLLGKKVDLVTEGALKPQLKDAVLREVVYQ
jgi:predicted nucleotidyltransferase